MAFEERQGSGEPPLVFISYARNDAGPTANAVQIPLLRHLRSLENRGALRVFIDERSLGTGDEWERQIRHAIQQAAVAVLLVTPEFLSSKNVGDELGWIEEQSIDRQLRVMPILIEDSLWRKHPFLARLNCFPNGDRCLLEMDAGERTKHVQKIADEIADHCPPPNLGPEAAKALASPPILSTPLAGRSEVIEAVERALQNGHVLLFGAPGQGKSALARAVAAAIGSRFPDGAFFVDLEGERQIENLPRLVASALGTTSGAVGYSVLARKGALIVLDGFDELSGSQNLRTHLDLLLAAAHPASRIIITCRKFFDKAGFIAVPVTRLSPEASLELFRTCAGPSVLFEEDEAKHFCETELDGHPLSIKIVARFGAALGLPLTELQRLWNEKWTAIALYSPSLDDRALSVTFQLTYDTLKPDERLLFLVLSQLPDGIDLDLIRHIWQARDAVFYHALSALADLSLLDDQQKNPGRRLAPPLTKFAAAKLADPEIDPALLAEVAASVEAIDLYFDEFVRSHAPQATDTAPAAKIAELSRSFHNVHASFDRRLGPSARGSAVAAAESVRRLYWAYHNNLGGIGSATSSKEDAIHYLAAAQEVFLANGMKEAADYCQYYIGNILWLSGDTERAKRFLTDIIEPGNIPTPRQCDSARSFAHIEYKEGLLPRASEMYLSAIESARSIDYIECIYRTQIGLIDVYRKLEQFDDARAVFDDLSGGLDKMVPQVAGNALRGRAYVLASEGKYDWARDEYGRAIQKFEAASSGFGLAHCNRGLGDVLIKLDRLAEAERHFDDALTHYRTEGKDPSLGIGLVVLGQSRLALAKGDLIGALERAREATRMFDRHQLNEPYELAVSHLLTAELHTAMGDYEDARGSRQLAINYFLKVGAMRVVERLNGQLGITAT